MYEISTRHFALVWSAFYEIYILSPQVSANLIYFKWWGMRDEYVFVYAWFKGVKWVPCLNHSPCEEQRGTNYLVTVLWTHEFSEASQPPEACTLQSCIITLKTKEIPRCSRDDAQRAFTRELVGASRVKLMAQKSFCWGIKLFNWKLNRFSWPVWGPSSA